MVNMDSSGDCWEWMGALLNSGYGIFSNSNLPRGQIRSHRLAYELTFGPIPKDICVCHICDNPPCCNPNHLFLGTVLENNRDRKLKGRSPIGSRNVKAKLTEEQVLEIRKRYSETHNDISDMASEYGISPNEMYRVITGKTWRHVPGAVAIVRASTYKQRHPVSIVR
jgi:hypothetical protein